MVRVRFGPLLPLLLAAVAGCRGVAVDTTYDPDVDFAPLRTYDWLSLPPMSPTAVKDDTVVGVLEAKLEQKGLRRDKQQPALLIAVQRTIEGSLNTQHSGYEFRDGRMHRYEMQAGTLVVDLVLAKTKESVWRGTASGAFRADQTPAERRTFLNGLIDDMFADFPPRK